MPARSSLRRSSGPGRSRRPSTRYGRNRVSRVRLERGTARAPRRASTARRGPAFTGRAAVLGLVASVLALSVAFPTQQYLSQRGQLAELERQRVAAEQRVALLTEEAQQLKDPAYVRSLARKRLQYVMPGDQVYLVIDPRDPRTAKGDGSDQPPQLDPTQPWYLQLWRSVQMSDHARADASGDR